MLPYSVDGFLNDEYLQNRESLQLTDVNLKRVVLYDASGNAITPIGIASGISDGRKVVTTAGTREALAASTACTKVVICAETDNTGVIVVGGTTCVASLATRRGIPLESGDTVTIEIDNLSKINLDSTVNGDGVTFTYYT